jgi:hypothetical protein
MLKNDLNDLKILPREYECLKKIANCESNIWESYEKEIQVLRYKNLIIQSDFEYMIRDDILREYILTKDVTLPDLSITYIPKRPIDFILKVLLLLETEMTKEELINRLVMIQNKSESRDKRDKDDVKSRNIDNIISDLRHFFQV